MTLSVKGYEEFQHYKDRNPPWIKFYNTVLDDYDIAQLPDASKAHLFAIWLLASRYNNQIPHDAEFIARKINATEPVDLDTLIKIGFLVEMQGCSKSLASCKQDACLETETETDSVTNVTGAEAPNVEKEYFDRGKDLLGKNAGGLLAKLAKSQGHDYSKALELIDTARTKQNPKEWIAAHCRDRPGWEIEAEREVNDMRERLKAI